MQTKISAATIAITMALASSTHAGIVIGSFTVPLSGGFSGVADSVLITHLMETDFIPGPPGVIVFGGPTTIGEADVGMTWSTDPTSLGLILDQFGDSDAFDALGFDIEVATTDGPQHIGQLLGEFGFAGQGLDLNLLATQTNQIVATLASFSLESPGSDPDGDGVWTDYSMEVRYDFISLPAPGAASMFAIGGVLTSRRRRV